MKKTNIKDLINLDKKFIDNVNDFKFEYCQGVGFEFNGRESFYGYYDCINNICEYISSHIFAYDIYTIDGYKLKRASIEIVKHKIKLVLWSEEGHMYSHIVGEIDTDKNKILTFDNFGVFKNGYKQDNKFVFEMFMSWICEGENDEEQHVPIGSFVLNSYDEYLNHMHWNAIRTIKLEEAGFKCQLCGNKDRLNVHHNNYDNLFMEEKSDLIVLCESCHKKFHDIG